VYVPPLEMGRVNEQNYTTMVYKHYEDDVDRFNARGKKGGDIKEEDIPTRLKWIAFKQQFFSSVLIAESYFSNGFIRSSTLAEDAHYLKTFESTLGIPYEAAPQLDYKMSFYFGPLHFNTLKAYEMDMQSMINLGGPFSRVINRYAIIPVFNFLNRSINSYGLIILLLTIMIKVVLFPLTYRSYMSMAKMRTLKPEIDAINEKIPKEKSMERQQATMALYKKAGVSPLGGCLPVLLQMPILIAMFRFFPTSIELRQESFLWAHDLSTYDSILNLPFNIPLYGDHVSLFTLLMTASTILTMKISNQATASQSQMPGMKGMMYIMPVMFMFMLNNWSSALTYYYFLANIITFGQNQLVKQFVDEDALRKKLTLNQKKASKKKQSGFQKRLEEMAKQRGYQPKKK
jgi:YidC/Oxa1 family membrane protein insertase